MGIKMDLSGVPVKISKICKSEKVGLYFAQQAERLMAPYVPMDTGMLVDNTTVEPFKVTYDSPYAHHIFEGHGLNFNKEKHPLATERWDNAMSVAKGSQLANEVSNFIRKNGI